MTGKDARVTREKFLEVVETVDMSALGFKMVGRTSEGVAFEDEKGDVVVVRTIVKAETFDVVEAMEDFETKRKAAEAKAKEKAEKGE